MIKRILVGLGGTPFTKVSTQCATELAGIHGAQTTGVTVVDLSKLGKVGPVPAGAGIYAQRMRERQARVTSEGIEAAKLVRKRHPGTGIVILSQYDDPEYAVSLLAEGAAGYAYMLRQQDGGR